jgi:cytochrome c biogenesis protein
MENATKISPGYARSLWQFLSSLKLTVVLLFCLAVLSIIGTLIPQNLAPQEYVKLYGLPGYRLLHLLDIVDMYRSWWFVGLLLLLVVNIIVCSIDRLRIGWSVIFTREPKFDLDQYRRRKNVLTFEGQIPVHRVKDSFQRIMARGFGFCRLVPIDGGFAITAERGRWTRLGVYAVHLSIVVLIIGGYIGSKFGFEGFVALPEGDQATSIELNRSHQTLELPFAIRCDDFEVTFYEGGQRPKEFRSKLTILENGQEVLRQEIVVNAPFYYKGVGIYQSSYGRMGDEEPQVDWGQEPSGDIALSIQSAASGIVYNRTAKLGESIQLPEGLGQVVLERYEPAATFQNMALGPALIASLSKPSQAPQTITLPFKFRKFDAMRRGDVIISVVAPKAEPTKERYYTGLQVVYDPGVWGVYAGFVLMLAGCVVVFFMSHQQVVVEAVDRGSGSQVFISGKANKNQMGLQMKLQRLAERLSAAMSASVSKDAGK